MVAPCVGAAVIDRAGVSDRSDVCPCRSVEEPAKSAHLCGALAEEVRWPRYSAVTTMRMRWRTGFAGFRFPPDAIMVAVHLIFRMDETGTTPVTNRE
jgi:hypothetical protein